ncbi:MAG: DUF2142 domain-containing protein [bacterium]|nr:DUF2142 domain-containing protein [bacterium]
MKNKWLVILLVLALIKSLVWMLMTPIFQAPDENLHFGLIQYLGENNRFPAPRASRNVSLELAKAAQAVNFNWMQSHPVWQGLPLGWQQQIKSIDFPARTIFNDYESMGGQKLPKAYSIIGAGVYKIFSQANFFWRFYSLRFLSVMFGLITVYLTYLISLIFFKRPGLALSAAVAAAFHPMASVIFSSVTYDSLAILASTVFLYFAAKFIRTKNYRFQWLALIIALLGITIKSQLIGLSLAWLFLLTKKQFKFLPLFLTIFIFLGWQMHDIQEFLLVFMAWFQANNWHQVNNYLSAYAKPLLAEVFPWYWGVFGWLEKVMPLIVYRILKIICGLSLVGIIISRQYRRLKFLLVFTVIMAAVVFANDFFIFSERGSNFGVQGRYFLPAVSAQMILLTFGLSKFIPPKILIGLSLLLNLVALWTNYQFFGWIWQ